MKKFLLTLSLTVTLAISVGAGVANAYSSNTGWTCTNPGQVVVYGNGVLICSGNTWTWWYLRP